MGAFSYRFRNAGTHIWGSAGCACGDVGNAGVVLLGPLRFDDLYQAAAAFSLQKFRNRAVFSGRVLTEIRFQKNTRPREAAANAARRLCSSPPSAFPASSTQQIKQLIRLGGGGDVDNGGVEPRTFTQVSWNMSL